MNLKCHECVDIAIKNGKDATEVAEQASDALSLFPVTQILNTSAGVLATSTAVPMCFLHRKLMSKNSSGLVTA